MGGGIGEIVLVASKLALFIGSITATNIALQWYHDYNRKPKQGREKGGRTHGSENKPSAERVNSFR